MRGPWIFLRCRLLNRHRWHAIEDNDDKGWECRDCKSQIFEREYLERVYDAAANPTRPGPTAYGGAAGVAGHGPPGP
jgi:hypothetical protein